MESKRKADSVLKFFFALAHGGKAGVPRSRLLADFECNERTLRRYLGLLREYGELVHIEETRTPDGDRRYSLSMKGFTGAGGMDDRAGGLLRLLSPKVGEDLGDLLVLAREIMAHPRLETMVPALLDHLDREAAMDFTYGGKAYTGVPLCFFLHREGQYLVARLGDGAFHKMSLASIEKARPSRSLMARSLPESEASKERQVVMERLRRCHNPFVALDRSQAIDVRLRFRGFSAAKIRRLFPQALAVSRPSPGDDSVHDVDLKFHGWLEASRFLHHYLGSYSVLSPEWVGRDLRKEVEGELEDLEA